MDGSGSLAAQPRIAVMAGDGDLRDALCHAIREAIPAAQVDTWTEEPADGPEYGAFHVIIIDVEALKSSEQNGPRPGDVCPVVLLTDDADPCRQEEKLGEGVIAISKANRHGMFRHLRHVLYALFLATNQDADVDVSLPYRGFFENCPDMYFIVDHDGVIRFVNGRGARYLGFEPDELLGADVMSIVHPEDRQKVQNQIRIVLDDPSRIHHLEFRKQTKDGEVLHVAERIGVHVAPASQTPLLHVVCRDITSRIEEEKRQAALREQAVRNQRLESLAILAGGVAHDLNNTLGPIVGYPDLLLDHFESGTPEHRDIRAIKEAGERASEIIRDLLALAQHERNTMRRAFDLNQVVEEAAGGPFFQQLIEDCPDVKTSISLARSLPVVTGAPEDMVKLLHQLLTNAFDSIEGEGRATISTREAILKTDQIGFSVVPAGRYAVLSVVDTGRGIDPADHDRIFEPFYSLKHNGQNQRAGLGLAVVQGILRDHRGYLELDSAPGRGTRVDIYLPAADSQAPLEAAEGGAEPDAGTLRVVIVDDRADQRDLATRLCRKLEYQVEAYATCQEAVDRLAEARAQAGETNPPPVDVVLLDMIMEEGMDGLDVLQAIRESYADLPVVLVSGFAKTQQVEQALSDPFVRYLCKPYTLPDLKAVVEELTAKE